MPNLSTWAYLTYGLTDMNVFIQKGNRNRLSVVVYVVCVHMWCAHVECVSVCGVCVCACVCDVCVCVWGGVVCVHSFMQSGGPTSYLPMAPCLAVTGLWILP